MDDEYTARRRKALTQRLAMLHTQHDHLAAQMVRLDVEIAQVVNDINALDAAKAQVERESHKELVAAAWADDRKDLV